MAKITNKQTAPSKGVTFAAWQLSIEANAKAVAELDNSANMETRIQEFFGLFHKSTVESYANKRGAWIISYIYATACEETSARVRFNEMVRVAGVVKPQTEKAKKLQAARASAKSATVAAIGKASDASDAKTTSAIAAGAKVKMEVSSIEAHIISMLRAGKYTLAAQAIAEMADKTALV